MIWVTSIINRVVLYWVLVLISSQFYSMAYADEPANTSAGNRLGAVVVTGNSAIPPDALLDSYWTLLGEPINNRMLQDISASIVRYYKHQGFVEPSVVIERHPAEPNVVQVNITEARLGYFDLQPSSGSVAEELRDILVGFKFSEALQTAELEALERELESQTSAIVEVDVVRRAANSPEYDLIVSAKPRYQFAIGGSNEGGELLGPGLANATAHFNGVAGSNLDLGLSHASTTDSSDFDQFGIFLDYKPHRQWGLKLSYSNSDSLDAVSSRALTYDFDTENLRLSYVYKPIYGLRRLWELSASLNRREHQRYENESLELDQLLNVATIRSRYQYTADKYAYRFQLAASHGLDGWGTKNNDSSLTATRIETNFVKLNTLSIFWLYLMQGLSLKLDVAGQYTNDVLPLSQVFTLGGRSYTRAYEPGELSGDRGIAGNIELRRAFRFGKAERITPYIYYGAGQVALAEKATNFERSAASTGLGIRLSTSWLRFYLEGDRALTRPSIHRAKDWKANFGLTLLLH